MYIIMTSMGMCLKGEIKGKKISIAFCDTMGDKFIPEDIRIFDKNDKEITKEVTGNDYHYIGEISDVLKVIEKI